MKVKNGFFKLFPKVLNENEFSAIAAPIGEAVSQTGTITATFNVQEGDYEVLFGYGRDRTDAVLKTLQDKKMITREQKRDKTGKFIYNKIRVITSLVS